VVVGYAQIGARCPWLRARGSPTLRDMHTERELTARQHPIRVERAVHRLRRHVIPSALIVGGVGLAAADVSVGIGWGLAVMGAALALQPHHGYREGQVGTSSTRSRTRHPRRRPQRPPPDGATTHTQLRSPTGRRSHPRGARAHRLRRRRRTSRRHGSASA